MKQIKSIMLAAALLASQAVPAIKVHTIGDSTMATYDENTTVTRGLGTDVPAVLHRRTDS